MALALVSKADGLSSALAIPGVWRGERQRDAVPTVSTGLRTLDDGLLGGWTRGALTQLITPAAGFGLSLLLPTLAALTQRGESIAFIAPPHLPCAPGLATQGLDLRQLLWIEPARPAQGLWALEQLLRSGLYAAVLYWTAPVDTTTERRLQLAAEQGQGLAFCFQTRGEDDHSYAATRLSLKPVPAQSPALQITVLKHRGLRAGRSLRHTPALPVALSPSPSR